MAVGIRADAVVFLAHRVYAVPSSEGGVVLACAVVVGVQSVHHVEFISVVAVGLSELYSYTQTHRIKHYLNFRDTRDVLQRTHFVELFIITVR